MRRMAGMVITPVVITLVTTEPLIEPIRPLATIATERHGHLLVALPHHISDFVSPPAAPRDLTARPQTIATRFSFVFEACGPPPGQSIH